jgi:acyl-coenzyme A thioesterase PaaI-like protein
MSELFADLRTLVPFVRTLGLEELELAPGRAVLRLPDVADQRNHVGGPHAGAMFTLGESASGLLVLQQFGDTLAQATPLAVSATIRYLRLARGPVTATAVLASPAESVLAESVLAESVLAESVLAELTAGDRPQFEVAVELRTEDGTLTGEMTVLWTLRPNDRSAVTGATTAEAN